MAANLAVGRLRWFVAGFGFAFGLSSRVFAQDLSPEAWNLEATAAIRDADENRLLVLIRGLPEDRGRFFLRDVPSLAAEAGWTNAIQFLLERKLLVPRETPEPAFAPRPRLGTSPMAGPRPPGTSRPDAATFGSATDVLAVAVRSGHTNLVRLLLDAGTDPFGPMRWGTLELAPMLNAMYSAEQAVSWGLKGRTEKFGSWENRRACLDLLLRDHGILARASGSGFAPGMSQLNGDVFGFSRLLDPALLDHVLTNSRPVTQVDDLGRSLLHLAAVAHRPGPIEWLVAHGVPVDQKDRTEQSPLQMLAASGGVDPLTGPGSKDGFSPRPRTYGYWMDPQVVRSNRLAIASVLLKSGARHDGFTAAGLDDTNTLAQILIRDRSELGRTNALGQTPLHVAVQNASAGAVRILLDSGADPGARDRFGSTPMHLAVGWWPNSVLPLLLKAGAPAGTPNAAGETPLMLATRIPEVVQAIAQGRPADPTGVAKRHLFSDAIEAIAGRDSLQALLDAGEPMESVGPDGQPLIFWVLKQPLITDSLIFLAQHGLEVRARDSMGNTALHVMAGRLDEEVQLNPDAMTRERARVSDREFERRAEQTLQRWKKNRGLSRSLPGETRPMLEVLLEIGVPLNATNLAGETVLHQMTKEVIKDSLEELGGRRTGRGFGGIVDTVRQLKARGLVVDTRDRLGMSPLLVAVQNHDFKLARELLELGCDGRATNAIGESALHLLSHGRWLAEDLEAPEPLQELVRALLAQGLDPGWRNIHGLTAAEEMRWNAEESRLEYYAHGDKSKGFAWPLVEFVLRLESSPGTAAPSSTPAVPDYSTGAPKDFLQVLMGPDSGTALERLVDGRQRLDFPAPDGRPLIHWIVDGSLRFDLLPILVRLGLDPTARDAAGRTVADVQAERLARLEIVRTDPVLLQRLVTKDPSLTPAVDWLRAPGGARTFVTKTNLALSEILGKVRMGIGTTGEPVNAWGQTVLHQSATRTTETLRSLLQPGSDLAARDRRGMTPFLSAVWNRQYELALAMLAAGADPLATNRMGDTAFHLLGRRPAELQGASIEPDFEQLIGELWRRGVDPRRRNQIGDSALEDARRWFRTQRSHASEGFNSMPVVILERWERLEREAYSKGR